MLAGVLILGGIAAIAAIADSGKHRRDRDPTTSPSPIRDHDAGYQAPGARRPLPRPRHGRAVDMCVAEVERGRGPVGSVDRASRSGEGWHVSGELEGGAPYACRIDSDGRVTDIEAGD